MSCRYKGAKFPGFHVIYPNCAPQGVPTWRGLGGIKSEFGGLAYVLPPCTHGTNGTGGGGGEAWRAQGSGSGSLRPFPDKAAAGAAALLVHRHRSPGACSMPYAPFTIHRASPILHSPCPGGPEGICSTAIPPNNIPSPWPPLSSIHMPFVNGQCPHCASAVPALPRSAVLGPALALRWAHIPIRGRPKGVRTDGWCHSTTQQP